jgi:hypothetical protein
MKLHRLSLAGGCAVAAAAFAVPLLGAGAAPRRAPAPRPDLATQVAGTYLGDVVSDARGSSREGVRIVVTRIGPNRVHVAPDYPRLPPFDAALGRYMQTIQNVGGRQVFLYEFGKAPPTLSITDDDASWAGRRE